LEIHCNTVVCETRKSDRAIMISVHSARGYGDQFLGYYVESLFSRCNITILNLTSKENLKILHLI